MYESVARRSVRRLATAATASLAVAAVTVVAACSHSHSSAPKGMDMDMDGMAGMDPSTGARIAAAAPADNGLHGSLGGYSYVAATPTMNAGSPTSFTFHITGPAGKVVTRFQPYEGQLLVFYLVRTDLSDFRRLTASMRDDGTWVVAMPALAPGSYRTYITFAAPDSSAGTPLSYSLSQPLNVSGEAAASALPTGGDTVTVDGYTLRLTGTPHQKADTDLGVTVTKNGQPVQQFDRLLDGYAHLTAVHSGDAAFADALSTGRAAGGSNGAGALTAKIQFSDSGTWRLFVEFETSGVVHTAAFTVEVPG